MSDTALPSTERPLRVAVVGGGPAGLYTADALTYASDVLVHVDVLERLPAPFGLLRYGVAPDHLNIKMAADTLQEVLDRPNVRLFCNVEIGRDVDVDTLRAHYDSIVYATGADADNTLSIPGEELVGSSSATAFVKWYNGHPEARPFDLSSTRAVAVVGAGNVALDVTRLLVKDVKELRHTDIDSDTLDALAASAVTDVHVLIRRGAEFAKFTTKELREIGELGGVDVLVDPEQLLTEPIEGLATVAKRNLALLTKWSVREPTDAPKRIHFHFATRPTAVLGVDGVRAVRVERSGETRELPVDLMLRAVGYRSREITGVPFEQSTATIPHRDHRVLRHGEAQPGEYAVGWAKRGPNGILGTNKADAEATAAAVLDDREAVLARRTEPAGSPLDVLTERCAGLLDKGAWNSIAAKERELGIADGRDRVKIRQWEDLVAAGLSAVAAS